MITGPSPGFSLVGETVTPEPQPAHSGQIWGTPLGAHLEPVPFRSLVQDRSPLGLAVLSFRTSMPLSASSSPSSMTSQVGQCPWQHPDQSGDPGLGWCLLLKWMCVHWVFVRERRNGTAQGTCE